MSGQRQFLGIFLIAASALLFCALRTPGAPPPMQDEVVENKPEPAPPAGQTYIGMKNCSACHFEQYAIWKKDEHTKAFEILPEKYKTDATCLKCHTTGFGEETGFKTAADTHLAGATCESCHGPGSKHQEICKEFATAKKLSPEQEQLARDSIYLLKPTNACIGCHTSKAHKAHMEYDKE